MSFAQQHSTAAFPQQQQLPQQSSVPISGQGMLAVSQVKFLNPCTPSWKAISAPPVFSKPRKPVGKV